MYFFFRFRPNNIDFRAVYHLHIPLSSKEGFCLLCNRCNRTRNIGIRKKNRHLLCVPDTDDVTQKNKNHETVSSRFFTERKTERSMEGNTGQN